MSPARRWPVVEFTGVSHDNNVGGLVYSKKVVIVPPRRFEIRDQDTGELIAARMQVPLQCAWALTVSGLFQYGVCVYIKK